MQSITNNATTAGTDYGWPDGTYIYPNGTMTVPAVQTWPDAGLTIMTPDVPLTIKVQELANQLKNIETAITTILELLGTVLEARHKQLQEKETQSAAQTI